VTDADGALARGVWDALSQRVQAAPPEGDGNGLWDRLKVLVDPTQFRPSLARDIEVKAFHLRWGNDYAMMANPRDLIHFQIDPGEAELLPLMDGTRTVKEIVVERFQESGDLELAGTVDFVRQLHVGNFLDRPFLDVDAAVHRSMQSASLARRKGRQFAKTLSIEWSDADRLVRWLYRHLLKWFFSRWVLAFAAIFALGGLLAFISVQLSGRFHLSGKSAAVESLILLGLNYVLTFTHELGHAVVLTHYGRKIKSAGFMIYFGSPAFFVDSSDGLMMERKQRLVQVFAGPYAEMIVAGVASLFV